MQVLKYTEEIQKAIRSKIKPEPWMHFALNVKRFKGYVDGRGTDGAYANPHVLGHWAIYVWDTREVLEQGELEPNMKEWSKNYATVFNRVPKALDNHEQLKGYKQSGNTSAGKFVKDINSAMR